MKLNMKKIFAGSCLILLFSPGILFCLSNLDNPQISPVMIWLRNGEKAYWAGDYAVAMVWFQKAAESGNYLAELRIGSLYENGRGVPKNPKKALMWLRKAAEQGVALAQVSVGDKYLAGTGVRQDLKQGMAWYRKASDQGFEMADVNIGLCYELGFAVKKDYTQAMFYYQKALKEESPDAQMYIDRLEKKMASGTTLGPVR